MKNVISVIELQQEKLMVIKHLLKGIETDDSDQSTSAMLKQLRTTIDIMILADF